MTKNIAHPADFEYTFKQNDIDYTISGLLTHNYTYSYNKNNQLLQETEYVAGSGNDYGGYFEIVKNYTYDENGNTIKVKSLASL